MTEEKIKHPIKGLAKIVGGLASASVALVCGRTLYEMVLSMSFSNNEDISSTIGISALSSIIGISTAILSYCAIAQGIRDVRGQSTLNNDLYSF